MAWLAIYPGASSCSMEVSKITLSRGFSSNRHNGTYPARFFGGYFFSPAVSCFQRLVDWPSSGVADKSRRRERTVANWWILCFHPPVSTSDTCDQGRNEGVKVTMPQAPKSPNNVASAFFNTVHLLPNDPGFCPD